MSNRYAHAQHMLHYVACASPTEILGYDSLRSVTSVSKLDLYAIVNIGHDGGYMKWNKK